MWSYVNLWRWYLDSKLKNCVYFRHCSMFMVMLIEAIQMPIKDYKKYLWYCYFFCQGIGGYYCRLLKSHHRSYFDHPLQLPVSGIILLEFGQTSKQINKYINQTSCCTYGVTQGRLRHTSLLPSDIENSKHILIQEILLTQTISYKPAPGLKWLSHMYKL